MSTPLIPNFSLYKIRNWYTVGDSIRLTEFRDIFGVGSP